MVLSTKNSTAEQRTVDESTTNIRQVAKKGLDSKFVRKNIQ